MKIGEKIAEARKERKMTQRDLGERLNVSDKVISKWETGKSLPDVETMLRISEVLEVSISELYESVEREDTRRIEAYSEERVWQYKKYSIVSCFLVLLAPFVMFLCDAGWTNDGKLRDVFGFILIMSSFTLFVLGLIFELTQFVRLYSYGKLKFYQSEYKRVLRKYGIIFLVCLLIPLLYIAYLLVFNLMKMM